MITLYEGILAGMDNTLNAGDKFAKEHKDAERDFKKFKKAASDIKNYVSFNEGRAYQFKMPMSRLFKSLGFNAGTHFAVYIMTINPYPKDAKWYYMADVYIKDWAIRIPIGSWRFDIANSPQEAIDKVLIPIALKDYKTFVNHIKEEYFKTYQPELYR